MLFHYTAVNKEGKSQEGKAEASSREQLVANLNRQGLRPIVVKMLNAEKKGGLLSRQKKVKLKDLVVFTRQLSTMVSAGVPLTRALATMQSQTETKYFKSVVAGVNKDIEGGISLGDAFAKYPNVFSEVYVNM